MTYEERVHWRADILKMKGKECPICHQPRRISFYSEIDKYCDRFLEICDKCKFQTYMDYSYPVDDVFTVEIVNNEK